jgi:hypothetical protein
VVLNLLVNAVEAMSTDSVGPRQLTVVSAADAAGRAVISIGDS